jgi:hypothetical protein
VAVSDRDGRDWDGPHVSIVALAAEITADVDDRGVRHNLRGIGTEAVVARLGEAVQGHMQIVLYPGARRGGALMVDSVDPLGRIIAGATCAVRFGDDPAEAVHIVFPFVLDAPVAGAYWLRLWFEDRLLTKIPLTIRLAPPIPDAYFA